MSSWLPFAGRKWTDNVKGCRNLRSALEHLASKAERKSALCQSRKQRYSRKCRRAKSQTWRLIAVEVRIVALEKQTFQPFSFEHDLIWNPLTFALQVLD